LKAIKNYLPDLLFVAGSSLLSYSAWLLHPAAGYGVGGAILIVAGLVTAKGQ